VIESKKSNGTFVFIDGMDEATLSYNLPIICGFCSCRNIQEIIIYKTDLASIPGIELCKSSGVDIEVRNLETIDVLRCWVESPITFLKFLRRALWIAVDTLRIDRLDLIDRGLWDHNPHRMAVRHGIWDSLYRKFGSFSDSFSLTQRCSVLNRFLRTLVRTEILRSRMCKGVFLGHNVYHLRAIADSASEIGLPLFLSAAFTMQRIENRFSAPPAMITMASFDRLSGLVKVKETEKWWRSRFDRENADGDLLQLSRVECMATHNGHDLADFTVVFLPVFCDSPFGWLDPERTFADYCSWVRETLNYAIDSKNKLVFRFHPSSAIWGEDSRAIFFRMIEDLPVPSNVVFDEEGMFPHSFLIDKAKHIVTYRGTVHLEALAKGFKPTVISRCLFSEFVRGSVFKPESIEDYHNILDGPKTHVSSSISLQAKKMLHFKEQYVGLKGLISVPTIFRGDSQETKAKASEKIALFAKNNHDKLRALGYLFASNDIDQMTKLDF
jgi:hypothetical protein